MMAETMEEMTGMTEAATMAALKAETSQTEQSATTQINVHPITVTLFHLTAESVLNASETATAPGVKNVKTTNA